MVLVAQYILDLYIYIAYYCVFFFKKGNDLNTLMTQEKQGVDDYSIRMENIEWSTLFIC